MSHCVLPPVGGWMCVFEGGKETEPASNRREATAETGETAVSPQRSPPPRLIAPWTSPSHPFLSAPSPPAPHKATWPEATLAACAHTHTHTHAGAHKLQSARVRHYWFEPLFSPRTSTDRMHVLLNIHLSAKNRPDIVSDPSPLLKSSQLFQSLFSQTTGNQGIQVIPSDKLAPEPVNRQSAMCL